MTTFPVSFRFDRRNIMHAAVWLCLAAIYFPVFRELYESRWKMIDYTHAYFVLPLSLWVAWRKRRELGEHFSEARPGAGDLAGLGAVAAGLMMFVFGWRLDFLLVSTFSLIPVVWGITRYLYGRGVASALSFPIFFLFFLVPPPLGVLDSITLPMRYGVSETTEFLLRLAGFPITRSGLLLSMEGREIFMGAPCSGMRSLTTMFTLAVAYVYFIRGGVVKKMLLVSSAIPFALFGNIVRVITLCLITYYAGHEAAQGFFHDFSGGMIFLIMIGCLMFFEHQLSRPGREEQDEI